MLKRNETPSPEAEEAGRQFRTIFLSDIHLGLRGCRADLLLDFLRVHDAETIILVGDIVDGWSLRTQWYWPQEHNDVVQKLLRKARKGTKFIYLPGNHDEFLRDYYGTHFGGIEVVESIIHITATGRRFLVVHGDLFDLVVTQARWLAVLGGRAYDAAVLLSRHLNILRRWLGFGYWSLSQWAKDNVKNAVNYISAFETVLAEEARKHDADGVVCGHIHHATIRDANGITYVNCGDWIESCTAVAEHYDGRLEIITWMQSDDAPERTARTTERRPVWLEMLGERRGQRQPEWRSDTFLAGDVELGAEASSDER
jgi:UDP-2,3-diacylglucosamine pyrophosphatase LpxH